VGTRLAVSDLITLLVAGPLVDMYLRTAQRNNRDGTVVRYVQLAHNRRLDGVTQAKVLLNLGREDQLDRDGLLRLVASINRYLGIPDAGPPVDAAWLAGDRLTVATRARSARSICWAGYGERWRSTLRCARCSGRAGAPPTWSGCCRAGGEPGDRADVEAIRRRLGLL
jgi:hypothetical protein